MAAASQNLTPVILELGGKGGWLLARWRFVVISFPPICFHASPKDPFIVFEDAEFDHAVELAMRGMVDTKRYALSFS